MKNAENYTGKRIMIIGSGGSGKSTLARQLGEILGLPVIHLDREFWNPSWVETPKEEWREKQKNLFSSPEWIADGNFGGSMEIRLQKADTVIFLDFNRFVCLYSVIKRRLNYIGKVRPDISEGCPERLDFEFLKWIWQYPAKSRPKTIKTISKYKDKLEIIVIKNRKALKRFIIEITEAEP